MANWISKGMSAEARDHRIEINGAVARVTTSSRCDHTLEQIRELAALYAEAVLHMTGAAPAEPGKLTRVGIGHVFQKNDPEPPVGTYLRDNTGDFWYRDSTGWHIWGRGSRTWTQGGYSWADVCDSWAPLTVIDVNDPSMPWN